MSTSPRDILTHAFRDTEYRCNWTPEGHADITLAALTAAGYELVNREARMIRTVGAIDALPMRSVIVDNRGAIWQSARDGWVLPGVEIGVILGGGALPAVLLHRPDWETP
jgi:hypothetical protein